MNKTTFIIPGFREDPDAAGYRAVAALFRKNGYAPVVVRIDWNRTTLADNIAQFLEMVRKKARGEVHVLGFSFGAMIALAGAATLRPARLYLCSLSPYFAEDLPGLRPSWKRAIGKKRLADFAARPFAPLAKAVGCPTVLFLGDAEAARYPQLEKRVRDAAKRIAGSTLIEIPGARHDIGQEEYLAAVRREVERAA